MKKIYLFLFFCFIAVSLNAQRATLVRDLNQFPSVSSTPRSLIWVGNTLFFTATTPETGTELWKSDGTTQGTVIVKDIFPGQESSNPFSLTNVNGTLYFGASDMNHGGELWKSDGTEAGTVLVKDIFPGTLTGLHAHLINVNGTLFFWANDGILGSELWKTDGTESGTLIVKEVFPGPGGATVPTSSLSLAKASGSLLFFAIDDGIHGTELWRSDGTGEGTFLVKDIYNAQSNKGEVAHLSDINGTLYFRALCDTGYDLWKSDGTEAGTIRVKDLAPGLLALGLPQNIISINGLAFFLADVPSSGSLSQGMELWKSDGTDAGTVLVKDIVHPAFNGYNTNPAMNPMIEYNGKLLFAVGTTTEGVELWISDGTSSGTTIVKDIVPGTSSSLPSNFAKLNGLVYFSANATNFGNELWRTDGTAAGTFMVKEIVSGSGSSTPSNLTTGSEMLFFCASSNDTGNELWRTTGTDASTTLVKDIVSTSSTSGSAPVNLSAVNNKLYFLANNGVNTLPWQSDGTSAATTAIYPFAFSPFVTTQQTRYHTVKNNIYYFVAPTLYKTDGTSAGTKAATSFSGGQLFFIENLTQSGDLIFFKGSTQSEGAELFAYNGNDAYLVKDINPGISPGLPPQHEMVDVNGTLFFTADNGAGGAGLWKSNGTQSGTVLVKAIPGMFFATQPMLTNVNGTLFFVANDGIHGHELWKSDGTASGTMMVKDINTGSASANISTQSSFTTIATVNGIAYFKADDGSGVELWKSDGTEQGTMKVKEIFSGPGSSFPTNFTAGNDTLYFTASDGDHGTELWRTNGTPETTVMVKDITPGGSSSNIQFASATATKVYFYVTGSGIWESDGTEGGTQLIADNVSVKSPFVKIGDFFYFSGFSYSTGLELWKLLISSPPVITPPAAGKLEIYYGGALQASNQKYTFPNTDMLASSSFDITVKNIGVSALKVTQIVIQGVDASDFTFTSSALPLMVNSNAASNISITFKPGVAIDRAAYLILSTENPNDNFKVNLEGKGVKRSQQITTFTVSTKTVGDAPFEVQTVATSTLPVTLSSASDKISITGKLITILKAGRVSIEAHQEGNENYQPAPKVTVEFCANPSKPDINLIPSEAAVLSSDGNGAHEWYFDDVQIPGEIAKELTAVKPGVYKARVSVDGCFSTFSDPFSLIVLGTENEYSPFRLYPNPANDVITVNVGESNQTHSITIYSAQGVKMLNYKTENEEIQLDLQALPVGIYSVKVQSPKVILFGKFIKK